MICENLKRGIIHSGKKERRQLPSPFWVWNHQKKPPKTSAFKMLDEGYKFETFMEEQCSKCG